MASMSAMGSPSVARQMGSGRRLSTMTVPKMKPMSPATAAGMSDHHGSKPRESKAEFTPIAVVFGLVVVALSIGAHTAKQQLVHSPSVWVSKKKRESIPEVEMPDQVVGEAGRFVNKSFLRKVAHIQDLDAARSGTSDPFYTPRATESLKSVGVNPRGH
ncbi:unnamed protein product [Musa acuminata var. zebrina]